MNERRGRSMLHPRLSFILYFFPLYALYLLTCGTMVHSACYDMLRNGAPSY
jgi:hypothetical protein